MKITPQAADAFAAAFAAKPDLLVSRPRPPRPIAGETLTMRYTNWRGETSVRTVVVGEVWFGGTQWHPEPQWMFTAYEPTTGKGRDFAVSGVQAWDVPPKPAPEKLFWVVWNPEHPEPVRKKYARKADAERSAKNLARKHKTQVENIYVLQLSSAWKKTGAGRPKSRHY